MKIYGVDLTSRLKKLAKYYPITWVITQVSTQVAKYKYISICT